MKAVDTHPLPGVTDGSSDPARAELPSLVPARANLERECDELAREIAHEVAAGDWVPWTWLSRYRSVEQRLEDFAGQMEATKE